MHIAAPNIQICTSHVLTGIEEISAQNGGSSVRCDAAADHGARSRGRGAGDVPAVGWLHAQPGWV
jgi:hypothetical protein